MSNRKSLQSLFVSKNNDSLNPNAGGVGRLCIVNKTVIANYKKT